MRGMGRTFLRGNVYWISYYRNGREVRESSKSNNEAKALKLLKRRLGEIQSGAFVPDEKKVTFENLVEGMKTDYELNNRRSLNTAALNNIKHLKEFFGFDRAVDITPDRVPKYQLHRRGQGASVATVNREFATLRRMFSIQIEAAARNLEWKEIDMHGRTARLKAEDSKNDEPWVLPLAGRLWEIVQARAKARRLDCPFVFHQDGQKIGDFRKAWQTACVAAELGSFVKKEPVGDEVKKNAGGKSIPGCSFMTCAAALPETCPVQASPKWSP
jgi:hypothetical protein